jgi:signal transduction histidine kinase
MPIPFTFGNVILFSAYGLVFVVLGIAILFQRNKTSQMRLATELQYLAIFGILHGFSEWISIVIPLRLHFYPEADIIPSLVGLFFFKTISFVFLLHFGLVLYAETKQRHYWVRKISLLLFLIWLCIFTAEVLPNPNDYYGWTLSSIWARYLLALPGAIVAGYSLLMQLPEFSAKGMPRVINNNLSKAAYVLFSYSFVAGVVVPPADFFPANVVNMANFSDIVHVPIQVFRSICGLLLAIYIIRVLAFYDLETRKLIEEADKRHAVFEERERIARDLHDGIIQAIYGVGLQLEYCRDTLRGHQTEKSSIGTNIDRLNEIIRDIRSYIVNLRTPLVKSSLKNAIEHTVEGLVKQSQSNICVQVSEAIPDLPEESVHNILLILKEALYNAMRHAKAESITIICDKRGEAFYLSVLDDGIGFIEIPSDVSHNGIINMQKRAALIGGELRVTGYPTRGTEVCLSIPCS